MEQPDGAHIAQLNVATALDDLGGERLHDFVGALDAVNRRAERSPGFVWRLKDEAGNDATSIQATDDPRLIVNLSVWQNPEALEQFVWNGIHKRIYNKKSKWFAAPAEAHFVMWWVPVGHTPSVEEAMQRLADLRANGSGERAFGWEALPSVQLWKQRQCA